MKNWASLMGLVFVGWMATSQAAPLDAPDTEDVDGQPCNSLCHAYLAWSHNVSSWLFGKAAPEQTVPEQAAPVQATTRPPELARAKLAAPTNATPFGAAKAAKSRAFDAIPLTPEVSAVPAIRGAGSKPAAPASKAKQAVAAATEPAAMAGSQSANGAATAADAAPSNLSDPAPKASAAAPDPSTTTPAQATTQGGDSEPRASAAVRDDVALVALVMARAEIISPTDLTQRSVAIDEGEPASNESVLTAIAAAGAKDVQLSTTETSALDRVIRGEVPAAILAVVSPEGAKNFPEIDGFKVFRIPLLPAARRASL